MSDSNELKRTLRRAEFLGLGSTHAIVQTLGRRDARPQALRLGRGPTLVAVVRRVLHALAVTESAKAFHLFDH